MGTKTILDSSKAQKTELDQDYSPQSQTLSLTTFRGGKVVEEFDAIGAEADVYLVKKGNEQYFLKLYRKGIRINEDILITIKNLSHRHKYFAELFEYGFDENLGRYYELSEYIPNGSLDIATTDSLDYNGLIGSLNEALLLLHKKNIIHRDLKPSNILLRNIDPVDIVLIDFGVSSTIADDMTKVLTTLKGTYAYTAPEVMSGYIGKEVDFFSLGMILLELIDKNPLLGLDGAVILHTLATGNIIIPENIDDRLKLLLKGLLTRDPKKRWGYYQVKNWIDGKSPEVYFDNVKDEVYTSKKYKFHNKYYNKEELAELIVRKECFVDALKHFGRGYIVRYLEKIEDYDFAIRLDELETPLEKLIYFIYSQHANLSFSLYGIVIDEEFIFSMLVKSIQGTLNGDTRTIFHLYQSGKLHNIVKSYMNATNKHSLPLMDQITKLPKNENEIIKYLSLESAVKKMDIARVQLLMKYQKNISQKILYEAIKTHNDELIKLVLSYMETIDDKSITMLLSEGFVYLLKEEKLKKIKKTDTLAIELLKKDRINEARELFTRQELADVLEKFVSDLSLPNITLCTADRKVIELLMDSSIDINDKRNHNKKIMSHLRQLIIQKDDIYLFIMFKNLFNLNDVYDKIISDDSKKQASSKINSKLLNNIVSNNSDFQKKLSIYKIKKKVLNLLKENSPALILVFLAFLVFVLPYFIWGPVVILYHIVFFLSYWLSSQS